MSQTESSSSMVLYVHRDHDVEPWTAISTFTQLLGSVPIRAFSRTGIHLFLFGTVRRKQLCSDAAATEALAPFYLLTVKLNFGVRRLWTRCI